MKKISISQINTKNRFLYLLIFLSFSISLHAQKVARIDPPFWYANMKNQHLQLLVMMDKEVKSINKIECSCPGFTINPTVKQAENKSYLFIDLNLPVDLKSAELEFTLIYTSIKNKTGKLSFLYSIKPKNILSTTNGVGSQDLIYLLMPDRFANGDSSNDNSKNMTEPSRRSELKTRHGGDIKGIVQHLDYLQQLGVTALWPTPLLENNQPKESYHGYAITDHYSIDPRFGKAEDYANLKIEAEKKGIKLIMDVIYNHVGDQHYLFKNKPSTDWFHAWDTFTRTNYKATTLIDPYAADIDKKTFSDGWFDHHMPDLNQKNKELASYLIQNTIWWIETYRLNGIRIDTYTYPDQEFMNTLVKSVLTEYPDFGIFGETWVDGNTLQANFVKNNPLNSNKPELPGVTDFQTYFALKHALTNSFGWNEGLGRIYHILAEDYIYKNPMKNVIFLDNHDLSRFLSIVNEDTSKLKMALGFLMTFRGTPCLYYGTEILMKNHSNPDALVREDFPGGWAKDKTNKFNVTGRSQAENSFFHYTSTLANYRKNSKAICTGKLKQFIPENGVYVYFRYTDANERVMVIINQTNEIKKLPLGRFAEIINKNEYGLDIVSGEKYTFDGSISLKPNSILILEVKQ